MAAGMLDANVLPEKQLSSCSVVTPLPSRSTVPTAMSATLEPSTTLSTMRFPKGCQITTQPSSRPSTAMQSSAGISGTGSSWVS